MTKNEAIEKALEFYAKANIVLTDDEKKRIEVADLGLGDLEHTGLQLLTYVNTERCCAKEMVLFPHQTCAEHRHPPVGGKDGKEDTFRCRWGKVYLYVSGTPAEHPVCTPPEGTYTVFHEIVLNPGEQYTIYPDTLHWFQSGADGAVISEFSTKSTDETDVFSDKRIIR